MFLNIFGNFDIVIGLFKYIGIDCVFVTIFELIAFS